MSHVTSVLLVKCPNHWTTRSLKSLKLLFHPQLWSHNSTQGCTQLPSIILLYINFKWVRKWHTLFLFYPTLFLFLFRWAWLGYPWWVRCDRRVSLWMHRDSNCYWSQFFGSKSNEQCFVHHWWITTCAFLCRAEWA